MVAALGGPSADHMEGVAAGSDVTAHGTLAVASLAPDRAAPPHRLIHLLQAAPLAHPHLQCHKCRHSSAHLIAVLEGRYG